MGCIEILQAVFPDLFSKVFGTAVSDAANQPNDAFLIHIMIIVQLWTKWKFF